MVPEVPPLCIMAMVLIVASPSHWHVDNPITRIDDLCCINEQGVSMIRNEGKNNMSRALDPHDRVQP